MEVAVLAPAAPAATAATAAPAARGSYWGCSCVLLVDDKDAAPEPEADSECAELDDEKFKFGFTAAEPAGRVWALLC